MEQKQSKSISVGSEKCQLEEIGKVAQKAAHDYIHTHQLSRIVVRVVVAQFEKIEKPKGKTKNGKAEKARKKSK